MSNSVSDEFLNGERSYTTTKIPPGGKKGQMLTKASDQPYDIKWAGHSNGADCGCEAMSIMDIIRIIFNYPILASSIQSKIKSPPPLPHIQQSFA